MDTKSWAYHHTMKLVAALASSEGIQALLFPSLLGTLFSPF